MVQCFFLPKIAYIELDFAESLVFDGEIVPLDVSPSVRVDSHKQIVFVRPYLDGCVQIAAFKIGVEDELLVKVEGGIHAFEKPGSLGLEARVEFAEKGCQVGIIGSVQISITKFVVVFQLLMHFVAARRTVS